MSSRKGGCPPVKWDGKLSKIMNNHFFLLHHKWLAVAKPFFFFFPGDDSSLHTLWVFRSIIFTMAVWDRSRSVSLRVGREQAKNR